MNDRFPVISQLLEECLKDLHVFMHFYMARGQAGEKKRVSFWKFNP